MLKYIKLLILLTVVIIGSVSCSQSSFKRISHEEQQKIINQVKNSKIILLDVYHNRCESCKLIEPVVKQLKEQYSQNPDISFLKYDLSNPFTIYDSRKLAKNLGLEEIYKSQKYSGVILFIDSKTKEVLDTLIGEYNLSKYNEIIEKRLRAT